jgi:uncharacterized protein with gpF-like domain
MVRGITKTIKEGLLVLQTSTGPESGPEDRGPTGAEQQIRRLVQVNSDTGDVERAFASLQQSVDDFVARAKAMSAPIFRAMDEHNKNVLINDFDKKFTVNLAPIVQNINVQPVMQSMTAENFNLITSLGNDELSKVKTAVLNELSAGEFSRKRVFELVRKQGQVSLNRARFIARDQSHKFNANLTRVRDEEIGITEYIWRNSNDMRVRGRPGGLYPLNTPSTRGKPNHWIREGKKFSYNNPPEGGAPGIDYNCRCYAEAILPSFLNKNPV